MTDQVSQFNELLNGTGKSAASDQGARDDYSQLLEEITNEQGEPKYSNVEDAIKALKNSQEHISTLEMENHQLREGMQKAKTVDDILGQLDSTRNQSDDNQTSFSMEDIASYIEQTLEQREARLAAQGNLSSVKDRLVSTYGEKADEVYANKAQELGLSTDMLDHLAAISPQAVTAYFDNKSSSNTTTSKNLSGTVNTEAFQKHNESPQAPKSIMYGASTEDMISAWKQTYDNLNNA